MVQQAAVNLGFTTDDIVSLDIGNGWAAAYRMARSKVKIFGLPHARARVTGTKLDGDLGSQNIACYADFKGMRYGYGDGIWNLTDAPVDLHQNTSRRYGDDMHVFLTMVTLAELGFKSGSELNLIIPVPPGMYNQVKPQVREKFEAGEDGSGNRRWSIRLRDDKKPREFTFRRIIVVPEGSGAFAAYRLTASGEIADMSSPHGDLLAGRVAVVDLGMGTGDTYTLFNGNLNPDAINHATNDRAGILTHILQPLLGDIFEMFERAGQPAPTHLTTAHLDSYLRAYMTASNSDEAKRAASPRISGYNIDLEDAILFTVQEYAKWIASNVLDPLFSSGIDAVLAAGGGWSYIHSWMRDWYRDRLILTPDQFAHTKMIALHDLNGVGQLRFAISELKRQN